MLPGESLWPRTASKWMEMGLPLLQHLLQSMALGLDTGFRRYDGGTWRCCQGNHYGLARPRKWMEMGCHCSNTYCNPWRWDWIPAFAGMTVEPGGAARGITTASRGHASGWRWGCHCSNTYCNPWRWDWIPAFAGMTVGWLVAILMVMTAFPWLLRPYCRAGTT